MRRTSVLLFLIVGLLIVLHQDFWNWRTHKPLVLGFIPIGLAWHVGISLLAGLLAWFTVTFCWPAQVDRVDPECGSQEGAGSRRAAGESEQA